MKEDNKICINPEFTKSNKKILRETRYLGIMKKIKTLNYIYSNKFAILSLGEKPIGVVIENDEVADTQKKIFEILWSIAKS